MAPPGDRESADEFFPLRTLEEVWDWSPDAAGKLPLDREPLRLRSQRATPGLLYQSYHALLKDNYTLPSLPAHLTPQTLVCHDYRGGYLEDRFINGTSVDDAYRFYNWGGIDTFVYFSHSLVTIPPPVWIDCAHLHGVKVLGTFITELENGYKVMKKILSDPQLAQNMIERLVLISVTYRFDGWLLNIENPIDPEDVPALENFVKSLTESTHDALQGGLVIWYDSVITTGELKWQNEMNENNATFFTNSDGIYLNYNWKEEELKKTATLASKRHLDVYVGIDVFGRGQLGGGGYNTKQALELIRRYNFSAAIFAPGWVYESLGKQDFTGHENLYWQALLPYLYYRGPATLPFITSFCQGFGKKLHRNGQVVHDKPWHCLTRQRYQPTFPLWDVSGYVAGQLILPDKESSEVPKTVVEGHVSMCPIDAFDGGNCLKILPNKDTKEPVSIRLMLCEFECHQSLIVSTATKNIETKEAVTEKKLLESEIDIVLAVKDKTGSCKKISLKEGVLLLAGNGTRVTQLDEEHLSEVCRSEAGYDIPRANKDSEWELTHHRVDGIDGTIEELWVRLHGNKEILLGWLSLVPFS